MNQGAKTIQDQIVEVCKSLHQKNMLAAADGNVSVRISDDEIWVTPSGVMKADMSIHEMARVNINGDVLQGQPSSELAMHLEVYKCSPLAKAVIHAHPPHAIAWSIAFPEDQELPVGAMSELILACGQIPIIPFAQPGTIQMAENLRPFLPKNRVMILARHGGLCWGEDLAEAHRGMERLEHSAQILTIAQSLGGVTLLSEAQINDLVKLRQSLNEKMGEKVL